MLIDENSKYFTLNEYKHSECSQFAFPIMYIPRWDIPYMRANTRILNGGEGFPKRINYHRIDLFTQMFCFTEKSAFDESIVRIANKKKPYPKSNEVKSQQFNTKCFPLWTLDICFVYQTIYSRHDLHRKIPNAAKLSFVQLKCWFHIPKHSRKGKKCTQSIKWGKTVFRHSVPHWRKLNEIKFSKLNYCCYLSIVSEEDRNHTPKPILVSIDLKCKHVQTSSKRYIEICKADTVHRWIWNESKHIIFHNSLSQKKKMEKNFVFFWYWLNFVDVLRMRSSSLSDASVCSPFEMCRNQCWLHLLCKLSEF